MITGDRYVFLGAHLTPEVKKALREESIRTGKSMSLLVHEYVEAKLCEAERRREEETTCASS